MVQLRKGCKSTGNLFSGFYSSSSHDFLMCLFIEVLIFELLGKTE